MFNFNLPFISNHKVRDSTKNLTTIEDLRNKNIRELNSKPDGKHIIPTSKHPNIKELKSKPKSTYYKNKFLIF